jgi:Abortive infection C-terminus
MNRDSLRRPPPAAPRQLTRAPLCDAVIIAVSRLVDDAQTETREPSHSALGDQIERAGLVAADPNRSGKPIGKAKRVRAILHWAIENDLAAGERLVAGLITLVRGCGGFRDGSPNFTGGDVIADAIDAFRMEGFDLGRDGDLRPLVLDGLAGKEMTAALRAYVRRAKRGAEDAALLTGTGKDLVEATAAHVLTERFGAYPTTANFPTLLGQAFVALGLSTELATARSAQERIDAALYHLACAVNGLRNKQGTGHGRPFLPTVTDSEARTAVESMGLVAERLLAQLSA